MRRLVDSDLAVRQLLPPPGTRRHFQAADGQPLRYPAGSQPPSGPVTIVHELDGSLRLLVSRARTASPDPRVRQLFQDGQLRLNGLDDLVAVIRGPAYGPVTPDLPVVPPPISGWSEADSADVPTSSKIHAALAVKIAGQSAALARLASGLALHLRKPAPAAPYSALLLGPSGVGKTAVARSLPGCLGPDPYGDPWRWLQVDCGELTGSDQLNRVIGAAPGYVGHQEGSPLVEVLGEGRAVVVFDEIEKAHPHLLNSVLLGLLDHGRLSNPRSHRGESRMIDARHSVIVFTSNLAAEELPPRSLEDAAGRQHLRRHGVRPELVGRLDDVIHFRRCPGRNWRPPPGW